MDLPVSPGGRGLTPSLPGCPAEAGFHLSPYLSPPAPTIPLPVTLLNSSLYVDFEVTHFFNLAFSQAVMSMKSWLRSYAGCRPFDPVKWI